MADKHTYNPPLSAEDIDRLALHGASIWLLGAGGSLRERMVNNERKRLQRAQDRRNEP